MTSVPPVLPAKGSPLGPASLAAAIGGLLCLGPFLAIPAIVLGHLARAADRKTGASRPGIALAGLWIGYLALVLHSLLLAAIFWPDSLQYRLKSLWNKPDYLVRLELQSPACPAARVVPVLEKRLRLAKIPHEIEVASPTTLEVRVSTNACPLPLLRRTLTRPGYLEFRLVHSDNDTLVEKLFAGQPPTGYEFVRREDNGYDKEYLARVDPGAGEAVDDAALAVYHAPSGYELMLENTSDGQGRTFYRPYYVSRRIELDGSALLTAKINYRSANQPVVAIQFNKLGSRKFEALTASFAPNGPRNDRPMGRQLAIIMDRTLFSAPIIREAISGGKAEISGRFTSEEAHFLADLLSAGSLPCPLAVVEERPL